MGWQADSRRTLLGEHHVVGCWQPGCPQAHQPGAAQRTRNRREDFLLHALQGAPEDICLGNLVIGNGHGPAAAEGRQSPPTAGSAGPHVAEES